MISRRLKAVFFSILLISILAACAGGNPLSKGEPTPTANQTLTAWAISANLPTDPPATIAVPSDLPPDPPSTDTPAPQVSTETPLPQPTDTQVPAPTETTPALEGPITVTETTTPLSISSGADLYANFLASAPPINGDINDWPGVVYALDLVVLGQEYYANSADIFGEFKVAWDANFLYIGVLVRDSWFVQTASGTNIAQGDSIEVLIDTDTTGDPGTTDLSTDDYQLGFSPGNLLQNPIPETYRWFPDEPGKLLTSETRGRLTNDGYMVEIAIAWSDLGITPAAGQTLGLLVSVSDNDATGRNVQQTVISFQPRNLTNPTTWAPLLLAAP